MKENEYKNIVDFEVYGTSSHYKLSNPDVKAILEFLDTLEEEQEKEVFRICNSEKLWFLKS